MKLLALTAVSTLALAGCTSQSTLVCPNTVYVNKVETPIDTCRGNKESWFTKVTPKPTQGDNDENKDTNQITTQGNNSTSGVSGDGGGSNTGGNDQQTRVKGDNGFGNGDQSAPGNSRENNNAENSNRSQRNHGQGNKN